MEPLKNNNEGLGLSNISKQYQKKTVVDNLNLTLAYGHVTCLLGPSGCGKSTTLRIAAGVEKQDEGEVSYSARTAKYRTNVSRFCFVPSFDNY